MLLKAHRVSVRNPSYLVCGSMEGMQASVQNSTQQNQANETQYSVSCQASSWLLAQVFGYQVLVLVIVSAVSTALLAWHFAHWCDHLIDPNRASSVARAYGYGPAHTDANIRG